MVLFKEPNKRKVLYLLVLGLLIRLALAWLPQKYFYYLISDDAYYYFSIAKNLISRGMLSADGITLTNGFHPLWLFVISPIYFFFQSSPWLSLHLVLTLSAFFDTAAASLIYKTLERLDKPTVGLWAAAFYLINPFGLEHTMNGLETAQNNFFLALLVFLSIKANSEWLKTGWAYLGTACGLALLSRTDNIFIAFIILAYLFLRDKNFKIIAKTSIVAAVIVLPWLVYNLSTFGTIIQTSGTVYPFLYHQQYLNEFKTYFSFSLIPYLLKLGFYSFTYNAFHYGNWILTLILLGILFWQLRKDPKKYRPLLWTLFGAGLFIAFHTFVRWSVRPWYPQAVFVLTLPVIALSLEKLNRYLIALGMGTAFLLSGWWVWKEPFRIADRSPVMLEIIKRTPASDRVGAFNSGYLQYFTDQKVINLDGLVNNEVLSYYRQKRGLDYFRQKNIRWLVDTRTYLRGVFGPYFGAQAESSLSVIHDYSDALFPGNSIMVARVLPESLRPPAGRALQIDRSWAAHRQWGKLPFFFE